VARLAQLAALLAKIVKILISNLNVKLPAEDLVEHWLFLLACKLLFQ